MSTSKTSQPFPLLEDHCLPLPVEVDLEEKAKELGIEFFLPSFSSLGTGIKAPLIPWSAIRRVQTVGYKVHSYLELRTDANEPETYLLPDPNTLIQLPWKPHIGWLACNAYFKGKPYVHCPRRCLIHHIERAREKGYVLKTGIERYCKNRYIKGPSCHFDRTEFILLNADKNETARPAEVPFIALLDPVEELRYEGLLKDLLGAMETLGWKPYQAEHEASPCQWEINWEYTDALTTADRWVFAKFMIKDLAVKHGLRASFIPQMSEGFSANGMHVHASLWSATEDKNIIPEEGGKLGMSEQGNQVLAGLMEHLPGMLPIFCPTVNSYKRVHAMKCLFINAYGVSNRWTAIRLVEEHLHNKEWANRFEIRLPDGAANPYLTHAAILWSALDGLERKLVPDPVQQINIEMYEKEVPAGIKPLPKTLIDASRALDADAALKSGIGKEIVEACQFNWDFMWDAYVKQITPLEMSMIDNY